MSINMIKNIILSLLNEQIFDMYIEISAIFHYKQIFNLIKLHILSFRWIFKIEFELFFKRYDKTDCNFVIS